MPRTLLHAFDPPSASPVTGSRVELTVEQIESAGLKEVLQTPGAALGSWALLDALLQPTGPGTPFLFREPLGRSREVKVALSGLFERFVARAYLERYFDLAIFAHLGRSAIMLDGGRRIEIVRTARGDLPDWIACAADLSQLTVAEAKGCHDAAGPDSALRRAWTQVHRVDITARGRRATVKRIAVATRWGSATGGAADARMSVRDPEDPGEPLESEDIDALYMGLLRRHIASLLAPLGHTALALSLLELTATRVPSRRTAALAQAQRALAEARFSDDFPAASADDPLLGAVVTRAGPLAATASVDDQQTLARLALRPTFVGVERRTIKAAISGDAATARSLVTARVERARTERSDSAGTWVVPLGDEADRLSDTDR